jgi:hypothetical protein
MSCTAVAQEREVSSSDLTSPTNISVEVNRERLLKVDEAISVTQRLREVLGAGAPSAEVVAELYGNLITLERLLVEDVEPESSITMKVLQQSVVASREAVHSWYLHSLGDPWEFVQRTKLTPALYNFEAKREAPTVSSAASLEGELCGLRQGLVNHLRDVC